MKMRDIYIRLLAKSSLTDSHELVLECMNHYEVNATNQLTEQQLEDFCRMKGLIG